MCNLKWAAFALGLACLLGADSERRPFKNPKAKDALAIYEREMKKAEDEFNVKAAKAAKAYHDALLQAKIAATKAGDLDEANAIQAAAKEVETNVRRASGELVIHRVQWGAGEHWADLTGLARSKLYDGGLHSMTPMPDPAKDVFKTLIIEGSYGGRSFMLVYDAHPPEGNFYFGRPISVAAK